MSLRLRRSGRKGRTEGLGGWWYEDPKGSGQMRFYDGNRWTDHSVPPGTAKRNRVAIGGIALAALLWIGAEAHDANCYTKVTIEALGEGDSDGGYLILPWNDPQ